MNYEQMSEYREAITKKALDLYSNDVRTRALIQSCVAEAMEQHGEVHPEDAKEEAFDIALRACALLTARIFHEDYELRATRAERDHYRKTAEESLNFTARPLVLPVPWAPE